MRKLLTTLAAAVALSLAGCAQNALQSKDEQQFRQQSVSEHQQMMRDMMKEMSEELREMTKDMKGGDVTSEKMKQMDKHMQRVSIMISRMSGFQDEMFKQMEEMKRDPSMKYPAK
jgi:23S rRNA pseudoU1915 N3-methylase RlmH